MASIEPAPPVEAEDARIRPLYRVEYDRLVDEGFFEDERVELLEGRLVEMSPQKPPHAGRVGNLNMRFAPALVGRAVVRVQLPLAVSPDSEPEPDIAIVAPGEYSQAHPSSALLVIEVAYRTVRKDLDWKARIYAAGGVADYWVCDLQRRLLVVHREPTGGRYGRVTTHGPGESVAPLAFPELTLRVEELVG